VKVGIIAALPREVNALVEGWEHRVAGANVRVWVKKNAVVVCAGMGRERAALAVQAAMEAMPVKALLSVGVAGACDPALRVGEIVRAGVVVDCATGERFEDSRYQTTLMTINTVADVKEKARLYSPYGVSAVDMEAAAVAHLARVYGFEFGAIKAISDEANFEIEGLDRFATADGQFRVSAFALHAALRPGLWGKVITLARNSSKAVAALTTELQRELDWYKERSSEDGTKNGE
jgi:adenosylhomocysteine nucleosidase